MKPNDKIQYLINRLKLVDRSSFYCDDKALEIERELQKETGEIGGYL